MIVIIDYLAPEFIFNSGVNHSVDIWALGVIIHEMIMLATPFRPARKSDLTALFVNIASVKVHPSICSFFFFIKGFNILRLTENWTEAFFQY